MAWVAAPAGAAAATDAAPPAASAPATATAGAAEPARCAACWSGEGAACRPVFLIFLLRLCARVTDLPNHDSAPSYAALGAPLAGPDKFSAGIMAAHSSQ